MQTRKRTPLPVVFADDPALAELQALLGLKSYSSAEVQAILGLSPNGLRRLVSQGGLVPEVRGTRRWVFFGPTIARYLYEKKRSPKPLKDPPKKRNRGRPRTGEVRRVAAAE
jgi:hypothetical protein